ncbi:Flp family type IVb pilin [Vibrio breoganii]
MDIKKSTIRFFEDEEGLTVVEYVLGAALLVVALSLVFNSLKDGLTSSLSTTMEYVKGKAPTTGS